MNEKTKKVHGVDLSERCFAYVGDPSDTSTWHCCIHVLGDTAKTINAIKNSLGRFSETKGIPNRQREPVWHTLRGAALAVGIPVHERADVAKPVPEPKPVKPVDPRADEIFADADRKATAFLKSLGYD
jgi:hypothetical protein